MDIGTGKASSQEQAAVPHYCIDLANPGEEFNAHRFVIEAAKAFSILRDRTTQVWVCGGSGLYIRSLTSRLELGSAPRPELRKRLAELFAVKQAGIIAKELGLQLKDPDNPARVVRAAENVCANPVQELQIYTLLELDPGLPETSQDKNTDPEFNNAARELSNWACAGVFLLDPGVEQVSLRIEQRVRAMFKTGLLDEVMALRESGFGETGVVADGIAYREAGKVLDGEYEPDYAIEKAVIRTRQYAKRQRTYFRGQGWRVCSPGQILNQDPS